MPLPYQIPTNIGQSGFALHEVPGTIPRTDALTMLNQMVDYWLPPPKKKTTEQQWFPVTQNQKSSILQMKLY